MSLDIVVEISYSIPMELVTAVLAEAVHEDGFTKWTNWMVFTVIGVVAVLFLVWIFVPDKPARQTEPVEPAQLQLVPPAQPEQFPQLVGPHLSQPQQPAQNEQIDEAIEQQRPIHTYNLRGRQPQSRRQSRRRSRGQSRSPPLDRQVQQQDQSDDEQLTLYLDDNENGGRQRISAGSYPTNVKKIVVKHNSYTHSTAEMHLNK